jgi:hypothetical protein
MHEIRETPYLISKIDAKARSGQVLAGEKEGMSQPFNFWLSSKLWFSEPCLILASYSG